MVLGINRKKTKVVKVGSVRIGGRRPVVIQSMTNVPTVEVGKCVRQIKALVEAGCEVVRVAVATKKDSVAFGKIVGKVGAPLIADIHFSPARAIEAIEAGAAKIRLNPGNIKNRSDILRIIDAAKMQRIAIRAGVNEASIRDLKVEDVPGSKRVSLMVREMKRYVRIFEGRGFDQLVLSAKSSDCLRTIEVNRRISENFDYPIHLGLTHAGLPEDALVPSSVALGTLLAEGIGDTVRVSIAGDPIGEVEISKRILESIGLFERQGPELIVCPTCARGQIDVVKLARRVKKQLAPIKKNLRVAVMGCVVNGPGEAADADLAVCAGKNKGYLYRRGKKISVVPEERIIEALMEELGRI